MGVMRTNHTLIGGFTPFCNGCGIRKFWDITGLDYERDKAKWEVWRCRDCQGTSTVSLWHSFKGGAEHKTYSDWKSWFAWYPVKVCHVVDSVAGQRNAEEWYWLDQMQRRTVSVIQWQDEVLHVLEWPEYQVRKLWLSGVCPLTEWGTVPIMLVAYPLHWLHLLKKRLSATETT